MISFAMEFHRGDRKNCLQAIDKHLWISLRVINVLVAVQAVQRVASSRKKRMLEISIAFDCLRDRF